MFYLLCNNFKTKKHDKEELKGKTFFVFIYKQDKQSFIRDK